MKRLELKFRMRKGPKQERKPIPPEKTAIYKTRYILKKIKTGDFDPKLKSDSIALYTAIRLGVVDKDLNILREDI